MPTPLTLLRLLIPDTATDPLLSDGELTDLLYLDGLDPATAAADITTTAPLEPTGHRCVRLAAATALEVIASSEALVSKKIREGDLATDGPAVSAELRARATALRARVRADLDEEEALAAPPSMTVTEFGEF